MGVAFRPSFEVPLSESSSERNEVKELRAEIEQELKDAVVTRELWVANIERMDQLIPHDDILVEEDSVSLSYSTARNTMLSRVYILSEIEEELKTSLQELSSAEMN